MSLAAAIARRLRPLVLPPRPDPARSRRIAEVRLVISALAVFAVFATIAARVVLLATDEANARTAGIIQLEKAERGRILDRKGRLLATNLPITVLHADPKEIMDPAGAARDLAPLLPRHDEASLKRLLTKDTRYVELDRKLTPARHAEILRMGIPGVYFRNSRLRAYPSGRLAAHILGQVDTDNNGLAGVEKSLDARLTAGEDLTLSIDAGVQAIVAREISKQIQEFEAIGGAGVMLDITTGEVLALVSLPDFNPNHFAMIDADTRWLLFLFADSAAPNAEGSRLRVLCDRLVDDTASPLVRHAPADADIDAVIDVRAVLQQGFREIDMNDLPALLRPAKGALGLTDYEKAFCPDLKNGPDIFDLRGIDRGDGAIVIIRPDQYVADVMPLDGFDRLAAFFGGVMLPHLAS